MWRESLALADHWPHWSLITLIKVRSMHGWFFLIFHQSRIRMLHLQMYLRFCGKNLREQQFIGWVTWIATSYHHLIMTPVLTSVGEHRTMQRRGKHYIRYVSDMFPICFGGSNLEAKIYSSWIQNPQKMNVETNIDFEPFFLVFFRIMHRFPLHSKNVIFIKINMFHRKDHDFCISEFKLKFKIRLRETF